MASRDVISADELDRMSPDERAAAVRAGIVTDWDEVPTGVRARVEATAASLVGEIDHRTTG